MTSQSEKIGAALAKAAKGAMAKMRDDAPAPKMYRTNLRDVPKVDGLKRDDGWVDMQVQFLIDKKTAGADHVVGLLKGQGHIYTEEGQVPSGEGDVIYSPRGCWHGFNNTSGEDVVLVWGWMDAGSIEASGYEVHAESHK